MDGFRLIEGKPFLYSRTVKGEEVRPFLAGDVDTLCRQPQFWTSEALVYMTDENQEAAAEFLRRAGAFRVRFGTVPGDPRVDLGFIQQVDFSAACVNLVDGERAGGDLIDRLLGDYSRVQMLTLACVRPIGRRLFQRQHPGVTSMNFDCTDLTDGALAALRVAFPDLEFLSLCGCRSLTLECLDSLNGVNVSLLGYNEHHPLYWVAPAWGRG